MNRHAQREIGAFLLLVAIGVVSRFAQDVWGWVPPNFSAIASVSLIAGYYFRSTTLAACVPLTAMFLSDTLIGGHDSLVMFTVYASLAIPALVARLCRRHSPWMLTALAPAASVLFYLTTNLAVWWTTSPDLTAATLVRCYYVAIPFFGYTLAGDLSFTFALVGTCCAAAWLQSRRSAVAVAPIC